MKEIVSVSLGTSKRDKSQNVTLLGEEFLIRRVGTDGDVKKFAAMFRELDGKVAALGVGGADVYVAVGEKRYTFHQIKKLVADAVQTPVVDGSGLKHTLEREAIRRLQHDGVVDFPKEKVLLVSAVDRFGMAQALIEVGAPTVYGDLMFGLGLPIPVRSYATVKILGNILLPIITRLPQQWIYPVGEKQESRAPKFPKAFQDATLICGDWHFIRRYAPDRLDGKTILTQTVRKADLDWLKTIGLRRVITTTPVMGGETFATNVMEGVVVALNNKRPEELSEQDYLDTLARLDWAPNVIEL
jgi:hypothetical protein